MTTTLKGFRELERTLGRLPDALDLTRGGLGDAVADLFAEAIYDRFVAERGYEGAFEANRGRYGEAKRDRGIEVGIGLEDGGDMIRRENFAGRRDIAPDLMIHGFGSDANPDDIDKGMYFHNGSEEAPEPGTARSGAANQPARRFWGLAESDAEAAVRLCAGRLDDFLAGRARL